MKLYTSLVRLKQEMNGGQLPPMTAVPEAARKVIDPHFTPGLGALEEDCEKGLRCPVRGCGRYFHNLGAHLRSHKAIGGAATVRQALSIPKAMPLLSQTLHATLEARMAKYGLRGEAALAAANSGRAKGLAASRQSHTRTQSSRTTVAARNLADRCTAQLTHRIIDLGNELGRAPSIREFRQKFGRPLERTVRRTFGTWNNALAQCSLRARPSFNRTMAREAVLESLAAWHGMHGDLPTARQAGGASKVPLLPGVDAILRAFGVQGWPEAMCRAASILNIYGGRYGLPVKATPSGSAGVTISAGQSSSPEASAA